MPPIAFASARSTVPQHREAVRRRNVSRVCATAHNVHQKASARHSVLVRDRLKARHVATAAETPEGVQAPAAPASVPQVDEEAEYLCVEATRIVKLLYDKRAMRYNEVKLILGIEDPRAAQRREAYGVEDESGASRDDIVEALEEVTAGRVPRDRVALRQLVAELQGWPYLEQEDTLRSDGPSPYAEITDTGLSRSERKAQAQARLKKDEYLEVEPEKDLSDFLPKWFGYSAVYVVSAIPIFITLSVLALLFVSSLK